MKIVILLLILGIWIGLLLGISFIGAPLKFMAPGITLKLGAGIGHVVFNFLNKIDLVFSVLLVLFLAFQNKQLGIAPFTISCTVLIIVLAQTLLLLPALDLRVSQLLADRPMGPSSHHLIYIFCEIAKVLLLGTTFFLIFINLKRQTYEGHPRSRGYKNIC